MLKKVLPVVLIVAVAGAGGLYLFANWQARKNMETLLAQVEATGAWQSADYENLHLDFNGEIRVDGLRLVNADGRAMVFEEVRITEYDFLNAFPHTLTVRASGVRFPDGLPQLDNPQAPPVSRYLSTFLRDNTLPLVIDYHYDYSPEDNDRLRGSLVLRLENAADLALEATIGNLPLESLLAEAGVDPRQRRMQTIASLNTAAIPRASATVSDYGLVDTLFEQGAALSNQTPDQLRQQMIIQARNLRFYAPASLQDFAMRVSGELAVFLEGGRTLSVSLAPENGGDLQQLQTQLMNAFFSQQYARIVEILNLEVSTAPANP